MNNTNKREASDTFGNNLKADIELLRWINERKDDKSEYVIAWAALALVAWFLATLIYLVVR